MNLFRKSAVVLTALSLFAAGAAETEATVDELRRENEALKKRNAQLGAELEKLRTQLAESEARRRNSQLWLGEIIDSGENIPSIRREESLLISLDETVRRGTALALTAFSLCDDIENLLRQFPIADSRRVQMMLRVDETRRDIRNFTALTTTAGDSETDALRTCRILAINPGLKIVVLSVGALQGAFVGLIYNAGNVRLRLISVRSHVAAAEVIEGDFNSLIPGMSATSVSSGGGASPFLIRQDSQPE